MGLKLKHYSLERENPPEEYVYCTRMNYDIQIILDYIGFLLFYGLDLHHHMEWTSIIFGLDLYT